MTEPLTTRTPGEPGGPPTPLPRRCPSRRPSKARRGCRWSGSCRSLALVIGASLLVRTVLPTGPHIDDRVRTAEGIEPGKTEVRYKEVDDRHGRDGRAARRPQARAGHACSSTASAASFAVEDTRFWVVRPRIGAAGVSGLGTLLSGAYIGVDAGISTQSGAQFVGLEAPPFVLRGEPGRSFVLRADDLGSLDVGSPVYYRRTRVGRVVGYTLDPEQRRAARCRSSSRRRTRSS